MRRRNRSSLTYVLFLTACLLTVGCKGEEKSASAPSSKTGQPSQQVQKIITSSKGITAQPVQSQTSSLKHVPVSVAGSDFPGKKDPFKPYAVEPVSAITKKGDVIPIQSYDVNKFKLVGIVAGLKENRALVIDPLGKGYVVKAGMLFGSNDGKIINISTTSVDVEEAYKDKNGSTKKRTVKLIMPKKSKETVR